MKSFFLFILVLISFPIFAQQTIFNDPNAELRNVTSFTGIRVSGGIDIYISMGNNYSLAVSAIDEKSRENIKTTVQNGILNISYDDGYFRRNSGDKKLRAYISFSNIERIEGSGASNFIISGTLNLNTLIVKLSGASEIEGQVKITDLSLDLSGASVVKLEGSSENLKLEASGASDFKNYDLQTDNCIASLSGASDARITINHSISASASGASTLFYKGNPDKSDVKTSGASSISQRN